MIGQDKVIEWTDQQGGDKRDLLFTDPGSASFIEVDKQEGMGDE